MLGCICPVERSCPFALQTTMALPWRQKHNIEKKNYNSLLEIFLSQNVTNLRGLSVLTLTIQTYAAEGMK